MTIYLMDTEFHDRGRVGAPIELISIGMVAYSEKEVRPGAGVQTLTLSCTSNEFKLEELSEWLLKNVLPHLPDRSFWKSNAQIAQEIATFVQETNDGEPMEFWGYFPSYDFVLFCQLFGGLLSLPKGWPHVIRDLCLELKDEGIDPRTLPKNPRAHDALSDALWMRDAYRALQRQRFARSPRRHR